MSPHARKPSHQSGKRQWNLHLGLSEPFMMLPSDMALTWDPTFRSHLAAYDRNRRGFKRDAAATWQKLTELGCPPLTPEANFN